MVAVNVVNNCCAMDALCSRCQDDLFAQHRGTAQNRGHFWAVDLEARGIRGTWPEASDRVTAIAVEKVADLTRDTGLRERLAVEVIRAARKRWDQVDSTDTRTPSTSAAPR